MYYHLVYFKIDRFVDETFEIESQALARISELQSQGCDDILFKACDRLS